MVEGGEDVEERERERQKRGNGRHVGERVKCKDKYGLKGND